VSEPDQAESASAESVSAAPAVPDEGMRPPPTHEATLWLESEEIRASQPPPRDERFTIEPIRPASEDRGE
jgi:hypothetical protein